MFGLIMLMHCLAILSLFILFCEWVLLAAVLEPTRYLPYGTSVFVGGYMVYITIRKLAKNAKELREGFRRTFAISLVESLFSAVQKSLKHCNNVKSGPVPNVKIASWKALAGELTDKEIKEYDWNNLSSNEYKADTKGNLICPW